jgi:fermentation-respiration switch protein FrsA (DUF1100 family)
MKKLIGILSIFIFFLFTLSQVEAQVVDKNSVSGSWMGKIMAGAVPLRIVFNLLVVEKDSLIATLDSPDQGAKNIKLGPVTFDGRSIKISAGAMLAEYNGMIKNDTLIEGTWTQAGRSIELNISRLKKVFTLNRPQEPKSPFPYNTEDVTFTNTKFNIELAGTVTIPKGNGPFPAVILITGSGAQNRNEELLGHKPFLVIADYLTRNGIAVLRYDDRGMGKSGGNYINATSADFATDAEAAFNFLKSYPGINSKAIGLIGHSEGGLIAPIVASTNKNVDFIVSLAGPGVNGEKIILRQSEDISHASGLPDEQIRENNSTNQRIYSKLKSEADNLKAEEKIMTEYKEILTSNGASPEEIEKSVTQLKMTFGSEIYTWFRYFIMTDPGIFWKEVKCPVLAINGEKDLQVAADVNLAAIENALKSGGNKNVKTLKIAGLNHLFQNCDKGLPAEYGEIEETFSPEILKILADWISDQD